jgi:hypothetical protein|tara:strand:+ start:3654 stop:5039 length:1386 start_codon:yes stop_codon:yes gene_type:complete
MYSSFTNRIDSFEIPVTEVQQQNQAWRNMQSHWGLIEDLIEGTSKIRGKARIYLKQEPREEDESYDVRLSRSVCPPYYVRMERMLAGMLTRKPVRLTDVPEIIEEQLFDTDLEGNNLTNFIYNISRLCIRYGHVGVLVDAPAEGGRPYWIPYTPRDIIGWRTEIDNGLRKLTQLRLTERVVRPKGLYGEETVEQIRVLEPGTFQLFQRNNKGDFKKVNEGTTSLDFIPFSVAYSNKVGIFESRPPLEDIAELNIKSYQIQSDYDNQLHISAVPMLAFFGFPAAAEEVSAGPSEALSLPEGSSASYIEPNGNSFNAQRERIDKLEYQINELGLAAILGQKMSAETATSKRIDRSQGDSTMMVLSQQIQDLIDNCLKYHAAFEKQSVAGTSFVNRDFVDSSLEPAQVDALLKIYAQGIIDQEELLKKLIEGEVLSDSINIEEMLSKTMQGGLIEMDQQETTNE